MADPSSPIDALRERVLPLIDNALSYAHKTGWIPAEMVAQVLLDPMNRRIMLDVLGMEQVGFYRPGVDYLIHGPLQHQAGVAARHAHCEPVYRLSPGEETE